MCKLVAALHYRSLRSPSTATNSDLAAIIDDPAVPIYLATRDTCYLFFRNNFILLDYIDIAGLDTFLSRSNVFFYGSPSSYIYADAVGIVHTGPIYSGDF